MSTVVKFLGSDTKEIAVLSDLIAKVDEIKGKDREKKILALVEPIVESTTWLNFGVAKRLYKVVESSEWTQLGIAVCNAVICNAYIIPTPGVHLHKVQDPIFGDNVDGYVKVGTSWDKLARPNGVTAKQYPGGWAPVSNVNGRYHHHNIRDARSQWQIENSFAPTEEHAGMKHDLYEMWTAEERTFAVRIIGNGIFERRRLLSYLLGWVRSDPIERAKVASDNIERTKVRRWAKTLNGQTSKSGISHLAGSKNEPTPVDVSNIDDETGEVLPPTDEENKFPHLPKNATLMFYVQNPPEGWENEHVNIIDDVPLGTMINPLSKRSGKPWFDKPVKWDGSYGAFESLSSVCCPLTVLPEKFAKYFSE